MKRLPWKPIAAAAALVAAVVTVQLSRGVAQQPEASDPPAAAGKTRIGTYDNRAIAVAYAASQFNPVGEKVKERDAAKQAGDAAKIAELEAWGKSHQRMLHFQGFGHMPVKDLLEYVKDGVAQVAKDQKLAAIVMDCDFVAADVEVVDVTDDLVELFNPTDRTRDMARKIRDAEPVSIIVLADLPADH
jgi:hypothetical protein